MKRKKILYLVNDIPFFLSHRLDIAKNAKMNGFDVYVFAGKPASRNMYKAYYNLGTAYLKLKQLEKSKQALQACLKINPKFKQALFNLGKLYQLTGEWKYSNEQIQKFLKCLKNNILYTPIYTKILYIIH